MQDIRVHGCPTLHRYDHTRQSTRVTSLNLLALSLFHAQRLDEVAVFARCGAILPLTPDYSTTSVCARGGGESSFASGGCGCAEGGRGAGVGGRRKQRCER